MTLFNQTNKGLVMIVMFYYISYVESNGISWDEPKYYCGWGINFMMAQLCQLNPSSLLIDQMKKRVSDDCCKSQCTPMDLRYYCLNLSYEEKIKRPDFPVVDMFSTQKKKLEFQKPYWRQHNRSNCHWSFRC